MIAEKAETMRGDCISRLEILPPLPNRTHKNDDIWARGPAKPPCYLFGFNKCIENNCDYRKNKCTKAGHENP